MFLVTSRGPFFSQTSQIIIMSVSVLSDEQEKAFAAERAEQGRGAPVWTPPEKFLSLPNEIRALAKAERLLYNLWRENDDTIRRAAPSKELKLEDEDVLAIDNAANELKDCWCMVTVALREGQKGKSVAPHSDVATALAKTRKVLVYLGFDRQDAHARAICDGDAPRLDQFDVAELERDQAMIRDCSEMIWKTTGEAVHRAEQDYWCYFSERRSKLGEKYYA